MEYADGDRLSTQISTCSGGCDRCDLTSSSSWWSWRMAVAPAQMVSQFVISSSSYETIRLARCKKNSAKKKIGANILRRARYTNWSIFVEVFYISLCLGNKITSVTWGKMLRDLCCSGILHSVEWSSVTDVSGQSVGPIFKGQAIQEEFLKCEGVQEEFLLRCLTVGRWDR